MCLLQTSSSSIHIALKILFPNYSRLCAVSVCTALFHWSLILSLKPIESFLKTMLGQYAEAFRLSDLCVTDSVLSPEENQIFQVSLIVGEISR